MKKEMINILAAVFAVILFLPLVTASIGIEKITINPVIIKEFSFPAEFNVSITNDNAYYDRFTIDTLLPINITPKEIGRISSRETKTVSISIIPSDEVKEENYGNYAFRYYVKGDRTELEEDDFLIEILPLKDVLLIELPSSLKREDKSISLELSLEDNMSFETSLEINSPLFSKEAELVLSNEKNKIEIQLDLAEQKAGVFDVVFSFESNGEKAEITKEIVFEAALEIKEGREETGNFLAKQLKITKTNEGNSVTKVIISIEKPILASLFTTFDGSPKVKKEAGKYVYEWEKELNPGDSLSVSIKTNYYIPAAILLLIIIGAVILKIVFTPQVKVNKKVVRVRTKSGLFAAKVILSVRNTGKTITNVNVIDRLPVFTELLPDKFGVVSPSEIKKRTIIWNFSKLEKGEEVMFSYIIYSKISVFGKLELPRTIVTYIDKKDIFKEAKSHLVYILAEEEKRQEI